MFSADSPFLLRDQIKMLEQFPPLPTLLMQSSPETPGIISSGNLGPPPPPPPQTPRTPRGQPVRIAGHYNAHTTGKISGQRPKRPIGIHIPLTPQQNLNNTNTTIESQSFSATPPNTAKVILYEEHIHILNERTSALTKIFQTKLKQQAEMMARQLQNVQLIGGGHKSITSHHDDHVVIGNEIAEIEPDVQNPSNTLRQYLQHAQARNQRIQEAYESKIQLRKDLISKIEMESEKMPTEDARKTLARDVEEHRNVESVLRRDTMQIGDILDFLETKLTSMTSESDAMNIEIPADIQAMVAFKTGSDHHPHSKQGNKPTKPSAQRRSKFVAVEDDTTPSRSGKKKSGGKSLLEKNEGARRPTVSTQSDNEIQSSPRISDHSGSPSPTTTTSTTRNNAGQQNNSGPASQHLTPQRATSYKFTSFRRGGGTNKTPDPDDGDGGGTGSGQVSRVVSGVQINADDEQSRAIASQGVVPYDRGEENDFSTLRREGSVVARPAQQANTATVFGVLAGGVKVAGSEGPEITHAQLSALKRLEGQAITLRQEVANLMAKKTAVEEELRKRGHAVHAASMKEKGIETNPVFVIEKDQALTLGVKEEIRLELIDKISMLDDMRARLRSEQGKLDEYRTAVETLKSGTDDEKIALLLKYNITVEGLMERQRIKDAEREGPNQDIEVGATHHVRIGARKKKGKEAVKQQFFSVGVQNTIEEEMAELQQARVTTLRQRERLIRKELHNMRVATANVIAFNQNLEVDVTCKHCLNMFQHAKILAPCGHSFCQRCLETMRVDGDSFLCEECGNLCSDGALTNVVLNNISSRWAFKESGSHDLLESLHGLQQEMESIEHEIDDDMEFKAVFDKRRLSQVLLLSVTKPSLAHPQPHHTPQHNHL